mmetsp:Transcript_55510/g.166443  ORF Transcript_55510/g.166443 Transcript_55510/m.166443 type:complete len:96 (-) Transcript_55510:685-972(-)
MMKLLWYATEYSMHRAKANHCMLAGKQARPLHCFSGKEILIGLYNQKHLPLTVVVVPLLLVQPFPESQRVVDGFMPKVNLSLIIVLQCLRQYYLY